MMRILFLALTCIILAACASMDNSGNTDKTAICKELKRQMIFNGATGNQTKAIQQRAETDALTRNYHEHQCS
jgi:ABC-type Fe3+-citrate transport system substrate-binding protein